MSAGAVVKRRLNCVNAFYCFGKMSATYVNEKYYAFHAGSVAIIILRNAIIILSPSLFYVKVLHFFTFLVITLYSAPSVIRILVICTWGNTLSFWIVSDGIVKYMKSKAGPSSKELKTVADYQKFIGSNEYAVVGM